MSGTSNSLNPTGDLASRANVKYHFPASSEQLEKQLRLCFGLPFYGRQSGQVPYGYLYHKESVLSEPLQEVYKLLWAARQYLHHSSLREVSTWLDFKAKKVGYDRPLSYMGLQKIMFTRPPFAECILPVDEKEKILISLVQWNQQKK